MIPTLSRCERPCVAVESTAERRLQQGISSDDPDPLDDLSRFQAKMAAMELVLGVPIGRLPEENPAVREDVKRDVSVLLAEMIGGSPSEELIAEEVRQMAERLTSIGSG